jgi:hypothetical protein
MLVSASSLPAQTFVFHLRGDQEVPPTTSLATGGCMATLNQPASQLTITCVHNVAGATVMHIHRGVAGTTGPVVFDLGSPVSPVNATWSGMTPADISDLLAGNLYVNIHTAGRPAGEIRGQILPRTVDTVSFTANGAQVVPPNSTSATASCTADLDDTATSLAVNCTHNLPSPQEAHVHEAPFGEIGPAVFTFPSASSPMSANVPMTPQLVADFAATFLYLDIHGPTGSDESIPADEIRGQIGMPPAAATTGTIRIVKATTPAGGSGFGFTDNVPGSGGSFTLNDGGTRTFSNVAPGTYTITENNPAGYSLTDVVCTDTDSSGNPVTRTATVHLQAAETVTCTFRNLQSVTPSSLFVFNLSGEQEVPAVTTTSRGGCFGQFDSTAKQLSIVCTHDVVSPTMMHVHRGAAGATGPVVFDLGNPTSPVQAVWNMAPSDVADLLAGNLYVNVHASGRPNGEIRGQIVPRSVDSFDFPMSGSQDVPPTDSTAIGACHADLADDATSVAVSCRHNIANPIGSHLHDGFPGVDGPIVFDFPNNNPFSGNAPLTPRLVADFAAGFLYTNVHSPNYTDGEIRGQLIAGAVVNPAGIPTLHGWLAMLLGAAFVSLALWRLR